MTFDKEPIGRFTRYMVHGWKFYVLSDQEPTIDKRLAEISSTTMRLNYMVQMSDYAVDNEWRLVKLRADMTRVIETYLRTL
jgi:hypothetical protein